jgi:hypothetical protein
MMVYTHPVMMTVSQGSGDRPGAGARWELYRCLGEPARLRLMALAAEEELAVGELAELLGESQPNVSRHVEGPAAGGGGGGTAQGNWTLVALALGQTTTRWCTTPCRRGIRLCTSATAASRGWPRSWCARDDEDARVLRAAGSDRGQHGTAARARGVPLRRWRP